MANGLTLNLVFPKGQLDTVSVSALDHGLKIVSLMLPLKAMYNLKDDVQIITPSGKQLDLDAPLQDQGLLNGSTLHIKEREEVRRTEAEEKCIVTPEDIEAERVELPDDPLTWPKDVREGRAAQLKEKANEVFKVGALPAALELYSLAISWLPPEDSDQELAAALFGNRALVQLKLREWALARDDAEQSLQLQPSNAKVAYRLGLAQKELREFDRARAAFRDAIRSNPNDRAARNELVAIEAELCRAQSKENRPPEPEVPVAIGWRLEQLQQGYGLRRVTKALSDFDVAAATGRLDQQSATSLRHMLRRQLPVEQWYRSALQAAVPAGGKRQIAVVFGIGSCVAAHFCEELLEEGKIQGLAVVESSALLVQCMQQILVSGRLIKVAGQIDSKFAIPSSAFEVPPRAQQGSGQESMLLPWEEPEAVASYSPDGDEEEPPSVLLICDRLSDDLLGERLIPTMAIARDAAAHHLSPKSTVLCVPSRAELVCAPLEVRCTEVEGCDVSRTNVFRFSAAEEAEERPPIGARTWRCLMCRMSNSPKTTDKCEMCSTPKPSPGLVHYGAAERESDGWWPVDLDMEAASTDVCALCATEQVLASFDFNDAEAFSQQRRIASRNLEMTALRNCRPNAMAVWWRLQGPDGAELTTRPRLADLPGAPGENAAPWAGRRQAVFYFGFEIGIEEGELMKFVVDFKDSFSSMKFKMTSPKLLERMGLVKFDVPLRDVHIIRQVRDLLDVKTNRLKGPIPGTCLRRRDKMISMGPFDMEPHTLSDTLFLKMEERIKLHVEKPRRGDAPITCVFRHGAFEGTVRWPVPKLAEGASVPRLPRYFAQAHASRRAPYIAAVAAAVKALGIEKPRVLEIGCGPVPLLSLLAARGGARAWAVEMLPELRELAVETVRDHSLEMVSQYKGYSPYSFFGEPRRPEDPSVRVMKAMPSTSLQAGVTPKLLDGMRAHIISCSAEDGPLGEDYLITMWHAASQLLEAGGVLLPAALVLKAMPVAWLPMGSGATAALHGRLCAGFQVQLSPAELKDLSPLCDEAETVFRLDLRRRPALPEGRAAVLARASVSATREGTLSGVAFWHEPDFEDFGGVACGFPGGIHPHATVSFAPTLRDVHVGCSLEVSVVFDNHQVSVVCT